MDGSKRRKRKNDRIDANKLARLGRVDPQSLHPIQHCLWVSGEVYEPLRQGTSATIAPAVAA